MKTDTTEKVEKESTTDGIKVPEDFQQKVHELIQSCDSRECLDYIQSACSRKSTEMYDNEQKAKEKPAKKGAKVKEYSSTDEPKD